MHNGVKHDPQRPKKWAFYWHGKVVSGNYDTKREAQATLANLKKHRDAQARGTRYERAARNPGLFGGIFLNR